MVVLDIIVILTLFLLTGFLSGRYRDRFLFIKSFGLSMIMIISGLASLILSGYLVYLIFVKLLRDDGSIFIFGVITILLAGIFNFFVIRLLIKWNDYDEMLVAILEYYIQWTTIFFTLYQFLTSDQATLKQIGQLQISTQTLDLNLLNIIILPVLLVSWIALAMVRLYIKDHELAREESEKEDEVP